MVTNRPKDLMAPLESYDVMGPLNDHNIHIGAYNCSALRLKFINNRKPIYPSRPHGMISAPAPIPTKIKNHRRSNNNGTLWSFS